MIEKPEEIMKNTQSRDTVNIGHNKIDRMYTQIKRTNHRPKTRKVKVQNTENLKMHNTDPFTHF